MSCTCTARGSPAKGCGMRNIAGNYVLALSGRRETCNKHTKRVVSSLVEHSHCHRSSSEQPAHMA